MQTSFKQASNFITQQSLKQASKDLSKSLERMSTGLKINSASDDAAGLAISTRLTTHIIGLQQAIKNSLDAISLTQTAESGMSAITSQLQRARELSLAMANGTTSSVEKNILYDEINQNFIGIAEVIANTKFNNKPVISNDSFKTASTVKTQNILIPTPSAEHETSIGTYSSKINIENSAYPIKNQTFSGYTLTPSISTSIEVNQTFIGTTNYAIGPTWTSDGSELVFSSNRSGESALYKIPKSGGVAVEAQVNEQGNQTFSMGKFTLSDTGSQLTLKLNGKTFKSYEIFETSNTLKNYSFEPDGNDDYIRFVYTDKYGNLQRVSINTLNNSVSNSTITTTDDDFNLQNNKIELGFTPNLTYINTNDALFNISKVNDSGSSLLTYWDETGTPPNGGYYTVNGETITFYNEARIGGEANDDAQDYYEFNHSPNTDILENFYALDIPNGAEIYNMNGSQGPMSLKITVGNHVITANELLATRPLNTETPDGVYINETTGKIEIYGNLRPAASESVKINYLKDIDTNSPEKVQGYVDGWNYAGSRSTKIDTYNLINGGNIADARAIRVYTGGIEVPYDSTMQNGFSFDNTTGVLSLWGDYRPDLNDATPIQIKAIADSTGNETTSEIYGINLSYFPEIYNLTDANLDPKSIRVYNNGVEVNFDANNGFQYNNVTNNIEFHGTARPNVSDSLSVSYVRAINVSSQTDDMVAYVLNNNVNHFAYSNIDPNAPQTFVIKVGTETVPYDPSGVNGYLFNTDKNQIEIYGDYKPDAEDGVSLQITATSLLRSEEMLSVQASYDVTLTEEVEVYGLLPESLPASIEVTKNGIKVPYSETNGFSYDPTSKRLSIHGSYRPEATDPHESIKVRWVPQSAYEQAFPSGSIVAKVMLNGNLINQASSQSDNGYIIENDTVKLVGTARPDVNDVSPFDLEVVYFENPNPIQVKPDNSLIPNDILEILPHLGVTIDEETIGVQINGNILPNSAFSTNFSGPDSQTLSIDWQQVDLSTLPLEIAITFQGTSAINVEPLTFSFQVGANTNDNIISTNQAFENLIINLYETPSLDQNDGAQLISRIDEAIAFTSSEQANIGAIQNRLMSVTTNLDSMSINLEKARSKILDTDYAIETTKLIKAQMMMQTSTAMISQVSDISELVLELLKPKNN